VGRPAKSDGDVHLTLNGRIMALTITATSSAAHIPTSATPPLRAAAPANSTNSPVAARPSAGSAATSSAQETAALSQLVGKYKYDISHGAVASTLSGLSRQITAAAKASGQRVTLPRAPAGSSAAPATPVASTASEAGKINVTA
jgi:hypothetical protein